MLNTIKLLLNILSAILLMFIIVTNIAYADVANQSGGMTGQVITMAVLFGGMYFLLIRPQSKKAKEHRDLLSALKDGDEVITTGGFLGKVNKIVDHFVVLSIANGVEVTIQKQAIAQMLPNGTLSKI